MLSKFRKTFLAAVLLSLVAVAPVFPAEKSDDELDFVNYALLEDCRPMEDFLAEGDAAAAAGDVKEAIEKYQLALEALLIDNSSAMHLEGARGGVRRPGDPAGPSDESPRDDQNKDANSPSRPNKTQQPIAYGAVERYVPAQELCRARLMNRMNEEGLAVYRRLFDPHARSEMRRAIEQSDYAALLTIGEMYPFAPAGVESLEIAGRIFAESADAPMAAYCYEMVREIYEHCPSMVTRERYVLVLAHLAAAYAEMNEGERLAGIRKVVDADAKLAGEPLLVRGSRVKLGEYLALRAAGIEKTVASTTAAEGYPSFGGDASGAALMDGLPGKPGGEMWRYAIDDARKLLISGFKPDALDTRPLLPATQAAYSNGRLFVNTGKTLIALDEYDGSEAFEPQTIIPRAERKQYNIYGIVPTPGFCTVAEGVVYAVSREWQQNMYMVGESGGMLAVDAVTGKELWRGAKLLQGIEEDGNSGMVNGPVTVAAGRLYVVVSLLRAAQRRNYLVCADARTGERLWSCFLCERRGDMARGNQVRFSDYVVLSGSTVVAALPDAGLIVGVETQRGKLTWALKYNQDLYGEMDIQNQVTGKKDIPSWFYGVSHPFAKDGRVFYAPRNSEHIYCINIAAGEVLWKRPLPGIAYVAGIDDGKLYCMANENLVVLDTAKGDKIGNEIKFGGRLLGHPAMTTDAIYVSTLSGLYRYDRARGNVETLIMWGRSKTLPANVIAVKLGFFLVNHEGVIALRGAGVVGHYGALLKDRPDDVELRVRRARALMADTDHKGALDDLKIAEEHAAADKKIFGRPSTEVVAQNLSACYQGLMDYHCARERYDEALKYADLALKHAGSSGIAAQVLLRKGGIFERRGDEASIRSAVGVYADMIAAEELLLKPETMEVASHFYAAARITALIKAHGRVSYAPVEAKAAAALAAIEAGTAEGGYDRLGLFYDYPNSIAALKGLTQMAAESEKAGGRSHALMLCKIAARNYEDCAELAPALETLQDIAADFGESEAARGALARLAGMQSVTVSDGRPAAEFAAQRLAEVDRLETISGGAEPLNPDVKLTQKIELDDEPLYKNPKEHTPLTYATANIVPQIKGRRPECMVGKVLIRRGTILECYDMNTGKEMWYNNRTGKWLGFGLQDNNCDMKWQFSREAVEHGLRQNATVLTVDGKPIKEYADVEAAIKDHAFGERIEVTYTERDPDDPRKYLPPKTVKLTVSKPPAALTAEIRHMFYYGDTVVVCADQLNNTMSYEHSRIYAVDLKTGKTLWEAPSRDRRWHERSGRIRVNNLLPLSVTRGTSTVVSLLECAGGNVVRDVTLPIDDRFCHMALACDSIVTVYGRRKECEVYDVLTGKLRMRMPLGMGAEESFNIAGERLLAVKDASNEVYVLDMFTGDDVQRAYDAAPNRHLLRSVSDRYMVIAPIESGRPMTVLDARNLKKTEIQAEQHVTRLEIAGGTIVFACVYQGGILAAGGFDADTGKVIWRRKTSYDGRIVTGDIYGRYLGIFDISYPRRATGARTPDGRYPIYDNYTRAEIFVVDLSNGEPIVARNLIHDERAERNFAIIDGRICTVLVEHLYIFDNPHRKE